MFPKPKFVVLLTSILLLQACGPLEAANLTIDEGTTAEAADDEVAVNRNALISCTSTPNGAGTVGSTYSPLSLNANKNISAISVESPTVLRFSGHDLTGGTSAPPTFSGLISFGTGFSLSGSFGDPALLAYITKFQVNSAGTGFIVTGTQRGADNIWRGVSGTILLGNGEIPSHTGAFFDRLVGFSAAPHVFSVVGYSTAFASFSGKNWTYYGKCPATASVVGTTGTIALNASASGAGLVTFLIDGSGSGNDNTEPFSINFNSGKLLNGAHTLRARVEDSSGNYALTAPYSFSTSNTNNPIVTASVSGTTGSITLSATPKGPYPITKVDFSVDGTLVGSRTSSAWSVAFDSRTVPNGLHSLVAVATDSMGHTGSSTSVAFSTSNDLTGPSGVTVISSGTSGTITFTATATDSGPIPKVEFLVDGTLVGTDNSSPFVYPYNSRLSPNGAHMVVARAYDSLGNFTDSPPGPFTSSNDLSGPVVTGVGASGTSMSITLSATASDTSGVTKVEFYVGSLLVGTDTASPYSYVWGSSSVSNGVYALTAKAYDTFGQSTVSAPFSLTVNNDITPPTVNVLVTGTRDNITLSATATDDMSGVYKVEFYLDGVSLYADTVAPYSYVLSSRGITNATHKITARATDFRLNNALSAEVSVTTNNDFDKPTDVVASVIGSKGTITLSSTGTDASVIDHVDFYIDGVYKGRATNTSSPFTMTFNSLTLSSTSHKLFSRVFDKYSQYTTSAEIIFTTTN